MPSITIDKFLRMANKRSHERINHANEQRIAVFAEKLTEFNFYFQSSANGE